MNTTTNVKLYIVVVNVNVVVVKKDWKEYQRMIVES